MTSKIKKAIMIFDMFGSAIVFSCYGMYALAIVGILLNLASGILICLRENIGENCD